MNPARPMLVEMRLCVHGCFPPNSSLPSRSLSFFVSLTLSLPPCRALSASLPESQELPPSQREGESTTLPVPDSYLGWRPSRVLRPAPPIVMAYFHTCCLPLVWQDHARKSEPAAGMESMRCSI